MASQVLNLKLSGLFTDPNPFSEVPLGALKVADNVVIDKESIAESRRGNLQYNPTVADPKKLFNFKDDLLLHDGTSLRFDDSGSWTLITSSIDDPDANSKVQSVEANQNIYFTTSTGIQKLDSTAGTLGAAGMPQGLDTEVAAGSSPGIQPDQTQIAYRIVWGTVDANDNLVLGAPSSRAISINNSGSSHDNDLTFTVPPFLVAGQLYQVYRSLASAGVAIEPDDELFLVTERELTAGEVTAGVVSFTDSIPEDNLGAALYTNVGQEGIAASNAEPPFAKDVAEFRDHVFYLNTNQPHTINMSLSSNMTIADTITISGVTYTAAAVENIGLDEFAVGATAEDTLDSMIRVVNRSASTGGVCLFSLGGTNFSVQGRLVYGGSFTFDSSNAGVFSIPLPATSNNDARENRVYFSKPGQPEAVPLLQFLDVGREDKAILRGISIRDALIVLKEDGVFTITGTDATNFFVEQLNTTIELIAPETADAFSNTVFCMSNQGVVSISVSGVQFVTQGNIERTLLELISLPNFADQSFGFSYDSDRKYVIGVPSEDIDASATQLFVFNTRTSSWTRWPLNIISGVVRNSDDKMYLIRETDDQILQERKAFSIDDYADDEFANTITAIPDGSTVTLATVANVAVGDTLEQGNIRAVITAIDGLNVTVSLIDQPWTLAACTTYKPIPVVLEWNEESAGNPGLLKHWMEYTVLFEDARFREIDTLVSTNFLQGFKTCTLTAKQQGPWGVFQWGGVPWGGGLGGFQPIRTYIPRETARSHWLNMRLELEQAFQAFTLAGISIIYNVMDSKYRS